MASAVREVAASFARDIPMHECGIVSITEVEVSDDGSVATIYVSALQHPEKAIVILRKRRRAVLAALAKKLRSRGLPRLDFVYDERPERGSRIDRLLADK